MVQERVLLGVALALVTSVSWALGNVFIQKSGRAVGAPRAMLWALLAGGLLAGACSVALDDRSAPFGPATLGWLVTAGVAGLGAYVCLFRAFERTQLSLAVPLVSSWSLFSALLSVLVFGERLRTTQVAGAAAVFVGALCVSAATVRGGAAAGDERERRGAIAAALGSALGFGVMVPAMGRVAPAVGEFGTTAIVYALGILFSLPIALWTKTPLAPPPRRLWGLLALTGCFETAGFVAVAFAGRFAPTAVVTPVASLAAALTVLYAWIFLGERPAPLAGVGAATACAGIVVLSL